MNLSAVEVDISSFFKSSYGAVDSITFFRCWILIYFLIEFLFSNLLIDFACIFLQVLDKSGTNILAITLERKIFNHFQIYWVYLGFCPFVEKTSIFSMIFSLKRFIITLMVTNEKKYHRCLPTWDI